MTKRGIKKSEKAPPLELIEYRLAQNFNFRQNIIVPNISWGIPEVGHECDLLILRPSGYAVEIEIKRSFQDLKIDKLKKHGHVSPLIRELWFCVSESWNIQKVENHIPANAGILIYSHDDFVFVRRQKKPVINTNAQAFNAGQRERLLELAHMRIWSMKKQIGCKKWENINEVIKE